MNIFAFLNKSSDRAGRSGTAVVAELTERNRRFEAFLLEKLADLESKIIPADSVPLSDALLDDDIPKPQPVVPDETDTWDETDLLLSGQLLDAQNFGPETQPTDADMVVENTEPNAITDETDPDETDWLAGFDENIDMPPDVDEALPDNNGEKEEWE